MASKAGFFFGLLAFFSAVARASTRNSEGPVDFLIEALSKDAAPGLWRNGISPHIDLPPSAPIPEVSSAAAKALHWNAGKVKILKTRKVVLQDEACEAVLIEGSAGQKILLLAKQGPGWWVRAFDPYDPIGRAVTAKAYVELPGRADSWGAQKSYFLERDFIVIDWKDAIEILAHLPLQGGKQYHSGWLSLLTADGRKYLTLQPKLDAYLEFAREHGLRLTGFAGE